jgi:DNA recombination protein RmuC
MLIPAGFGFLIGLLVVTAVVFARRRYEQELAARLRQAAEKQRSDELDRILAGLKDAFKALSHDALSQNTDDFLKLARTQLGQQTTENAATLDEKKKLIDAQLEEIGKKLRDMTTTLQSVENRHVEQYGSLKSQIERATQVTGQLSESTAQLRAALSNPQRRGQWGERMAEDVLRLVGLREGFNYARQTQITDGSRPDYTFKLPNDRCIHMDVKFPLARYLEMIDADNPAQRDTLAQHFIRDVRARIKEVTTREYIDPAGGTVDYVLIFIPVESVYHFIHEQDATVLDDAMKSKVVLCSPVTLYAILAVVRQAIDNFHLEQGAKQILNLLADFGKQWNKYTEVMDRLGDRLDGALKTFEELKSTRTRQLEKQLEKIDQLRAADLAASDDRAEQASP